MWKSSPSTSKWYWRSTNAKPCPSSSRKACSRSTRAVSKSRSATEPVRSRKSRTYGSRVSCWASSESAAVEHGWSRNVLLNQIMRQLHARAGAAPSNFPARLPAADSELAQQLTRDPYVLDFLDLTGSVAERDLETALVDRLQAFLLELGHGFAFVERQYHFEVDGDDFHIDLLFFNYVQSRFVVVELKIGRFEPQHAGQLAFYVSWVDANLRRSDRHSPTIGILMCASRNDSVVRYSLAGATSPLAVAGYTYDSLPEAVRELVPSDEQLGTAIKATLTDTACATDSVSVARSVDQPALEDTHRRQPLGDNPTE